MNKLNNAVSQAQTQSHYLLCSDYKSALPASAAPISPDSTILISTLGAPPLEPCASIFLTMSMPLVTFPNTTCFPSSHDVFTVVRKNWLPLVPGPALAIDRYPGSEC